DQPPINRRQRQRLEGIEWLFGANGLGRSDHQHEILDADAVGGRFVIAGLVRQDHAAPKRNGAELRYARRAFEYRKIAADAVSCPMVEIDSSLPERRARQRVELGASSVLGKNSSRDSDMALEHPGEAIAHFLARLTDNDRPRDISSAVFVLGTGINQKELFLSDVPVRCVRDAVMHNGAIRSRASDGGKRDILERACITTEAFERRYRVDFRELA